MVRHDETRSENSLQTNIFPYQGTGCESQARIGTRDARGETVQQVFPTKPPEHATAL